MKELVIIGAGPAGLAAAAYAMRKRLDFIVVSSTLGGKSTMQVRFPNASEHRVIRPKELVKTYQDQLEYLTHLYTLDTVESVDLNGDELSLALREGERIRAKAVLVATGTQPRPLGVNGESTFYGKGLGYSSVSYSHLLEGKRAFLLGDTDRVLHSAVELSAQVENVFLLLEPSGAYSADLLERVRGLTTVEVIEDHDVLEFGGGEFAERVVVESDSGSRRTIEADGFFVERHPVPNSGIVAPLVELGPEGHILVNEGGSTSRDGVFAAGDVTSVGLEQILAAMGDATKAVLSAYEYVLNLGR